jgi:hypothetical protein
MYAMPATFRNRTSASNHTPNVQGRVVVNVYRLCAAVRQRRDDWCCDGDGLVGTRGVVGPERRALLNRQGARGLQAAELVPAASGATTS